MQDERDSGSDMEENGNEQHSGSENGSIGQHSEVVVKEFQEILVLMHRKKTFLNKYNLLNSC